MEQYKSNKVKSIRQFRSEKRKNPLIFVLLILGLILPITLSGALPISLGTVFGNTPEKKISYTDINQNHWAYQSIMEMTQAKIIVGYPNGCFRPKELVTYGEFIKMATVAGKAVKDNINRKAFEHWAKPYYDAGLNMQYYTGYDIKEAALDQPIPRGYMALIVSSMIGDIKVSDYGDYGTFLDQIRDVNSRTPYEYEIVRAYATGILAGYPDNTFRPEKPLTRAEAAAVIARLVKKIENQKDITVPEDKETKPLVIIGSVDSSEPDGTLTFTIPNYGTNLSAQQKQLYDALKQHRPNEADAIFNSVVEFSQKPLGPSNQGMRKQYFGDYPVLIDHVGEVVRIYIYPIGSTSEYWETKPGEINEEFF